MRSVKVNIVLFKDTVLPAVEFIVS
jgi:hypothetical protein